MRKAIKKYKRKPALVEAIQWDGTFTTYREIKDVYSDIKDVVVGDMISPELGGSWVVNTPEGQRVVSPGDYIIRDKKREYYVVKPNVFKETYEEALNAWGR